jgi:hypothetical protein
MEPTVGTVEQAALAAKAEVYIPAARAAWAAWQQ